MPIYDFKCPSCGEQEELLVKSHDAEVHCSMCNESMQRVASATNCIVWKGSPASATTVMPHMKFDRLNNKPIVRKRSGDGE